MRYTITLKQDESAQLEAEAKSLGLPIATYIASLIRQILAERTVKVNH